MLFIRPQWGQHKEHRNGCLLWSKYCLGMLSEWVWLQRMKPNSMQRRSEALLWKSKPWMYAFLYVLQTFCKLTILSPHHYPALPSAFFILCVSVHCTKKILQGVVNISGVKYIKIGQILRKSDILILYIWCRPIARVLTRVFWR